MLRPEEEPEGQLEATAPEDGSEGEVQKEEVSITAYQMGLREIRWNLLTKVRDVEGLLSRLDAVLENPNLRVYPFETDEGVQIITQEKDRLGFHGIRKQDPTPEGGKRISITRFREVMENSREEYQNQISQLEGLLDALDTALENPEVRVSCFRTGDGFEMETEEKGPLGFELHQEEI